MYLALVGELEGIADVVDQDFIEAQRVAHQQVGNLAFDLESQCQTARYGLVGIQGASGVQNALQAEF